MDIFESRYYKLNKALLSFIGQWPYDSFNKRVLVTGLMIILTSTQLAAQTAAVYSSLDDIDYVLDCLPSLLGDILIIAQISSYCINTKEAKILVDAMQADWEVPREKMEEVIMQKYAEKSRRYTYVYTYILFLVLAFVMTMPVLPRFINMGNTSSNRPALPHNVEYYVDAEKYYYYMLIHAYAEMIMLISGMIASDSMLIVFVHHVCAMMTVLEHKLARIVEEDKLDYDSKPRLEDDKPYEKMCECIERHNEILSFAKAMEQLYMVSFLVQAGLNMIVISITGVRVLASLNSIHELLRNLGHASAEFVHIYFECAMGQELMDHSLHLQESVANALWYMTSLRTRKLIAFMLSRSQLICTLNAGKVFVMSMEFFSLVMILISNLPLVVQRYWLSIVHEYTNVK